MGVLHTEHMEHMAVTCRTHGCMLYPSWVLMYREPNTTTTENTWLLHAEHMAACCIHHGY